MAETVFINGVGGFLGQYIVEAFGEAGYNLRVSDMENADFSVAKKYDAEIMPGDIGDFDLLKKQVAGVDRVIHVAGLFDYGLPLELLERVNHQGVHNICRAIIEVNPNIKRFVQLSTVGCYGKPMTNPVHEGDPKRPRNNYEKTKWRGEQAAFSYWRSHGLPVTALCPSLVYGPGSRYGYVMFLGLFAICKELGWEKLRGPKDGRLLHGVHAADVARAIVLLAEHDGAVGRRFNCADKSPILSSEMYRILAEGVGLEYVPFIPEMAPITYPVANLVDSSPLNTTWLLNKWASWKWDEMKQKYGLSDNLRPRLDKDWAGYFTRDHVFDYTKLANLGYEWVYPDIEEAMIETIQWYKDHEWLP